MNPADGYFDSQLTNEQIATILNTLRPAWQQQLTVMQQHPIGSQYTAEGDTQVYTLVAYELPNTGSTPVPWFLTQTGWDDGEDPNPEVINEIVDGWTWPHPDMTAVEPNPNTSAFARGYATVKKASINRLDRNTVVYDTPDNVDQIEALWRSLPPNWAYRKAETALSRAAYDQALGLRAVAQACGSNQTRTARLVGIDQSRISRAIKATDGPLN